MNAVLQVQNGAPVDLLLGTDVLGRLGFGLVQQEGEGHITDLLKQTDRETGETGGPGHKDAGAPAAVVKLLQATRLPARHSRLIRVGIANDKGAVEEMTLFEPETQTVNEKGLAMADAVVGVGSGGEVTLVIVNHGISPVRLPEGEVLGRLHPAVVVDDPVNTPEEERVRNRSTAVEGSGGRSDQHIAAVCPDTVMQEERKHQLLATLKLEEARLTEDESRQVTGLVNEYLDLFALSSTELGRTTVVEHSIDTTDHLPVKQPPRRVPFALRGKVVQLMDEMLAQGVITPSSSPWASPIVLVAKKDGSTRFCVDYRKLNAITKLDVFPLPRIDESLDLLSGTEYFSSLDLASGYWQVGMEPAAREKTAFTTHSGLYEFQVMPFGLCNRVGERVFVHTPTLKKGPAYKLASPFKGPYRVVATHDNGVEIVPVANPRSPPIRVALNRVRRCPDEVNLPGEALTSVTRAEEPPSREDNPEAKERGKPGGTHCQPQPPGGEASHQEADRNNSGGATWARRLRPRKPQLGDELV